LAQRRGPDIGGTTFRPIFFEKSETQEKIKSFKNI